MSTNSFKDRFASGRPVLFDGAIGTELYRRGLFINRCFEEANISQPNLVQGIHRDYVEAGAEVVMTNSFGANHLKLRGHNLHEQVYTINLRAAELARSELGLGQWAAGSIGPLGVRIEPYGPTSFAEARSYFRDQARGLADGGVDLIFLETFVDIYELEQAVSGVREVFSGPVFASMVVGEDGFSPLGRPVDQMLGRVQDWDVDAIGLNCGVGPGPMLSMIEKVKSIVKKPLCALPNAGLPRLVEGRSIYMSTPEYLAHFVGEFLRQGVLVIGGCCGTTPDHIRAMANALRQRASMDEKNGVSHQARVSSVSRAEEEARVDFADKSKWSAKIARGEKVSSVELLPPAGIDPGKIIERSRYLKEQGVDAINIPDGPRASARMSAVLTAVMVEQQAGIESVLHYTCRDRNLLGMQSDMLGAHAIGLRNMLIITGDPPKLGDYPNMTGVFDVDAIGLTNMVHRLNGGLDLGGKPIGAASALSLGVGVNPGHRDLEYELGRFAWKVKAGAEWAITQPVFDVDAVFHLLDEINKRGVEVPIIAGVWPLTSYRNALFMANEVPGIVIPGPILKRMEEPRTPDQAKLEGVKIAAEMTAALGDRVAGIQVSAPFGRIDLALQVLGG